MVDASTGWTAAAGDCGARAADARGAMREPEDAGLQPLLHTIESEIIPRLLMSHAKGASERAPDAQGGLAAPVAITAREVHEFAELVCRHELPVATAFMDALRERGLPLERIYIDLLAPAARLLGTWWESDERDFAQVTTALCRMHQLLHQYSHAFGTGAAVGASAPRILLSPLPGEQHTFGLIMVGEFFRREGWDVWDVYPECPQDLYDELQTQHFDVVGFSLASVARLPVLGRLITGARQASLNSALRVLVGGAPVSADTTLALRAGADAAATDAQSAPLAARELVATTGSQQG